MTPMQRLKQKEAYLPPERVKRLLNYDPETGKITWKFGKRSGKHDPNDDSAGCVRDGYVVISIANENYLGHRVAWVLMTGAWPEGIVDHEDGDGINNRWGNLREATRSQNNVNARLRKDNSTGFKGVERVGHRFKAAISFNGVAYRLGVFDTAEEAHAAYCGASVILHGEFACNGRRAA